MAVADDGATLDPRGIDMTTTTPPDPLSESGISRRDALRRGATLSVALAAAMPVVQGLGRIAYAQSSPPPEEPPPGEPPPPVETTPSHFQMLVRFNDDATLRGIKWDQGWGALFKQGNKCWDPNAAGFEAATGGQVQFMNANAPVAATSRGFEAAIPAGVSVIHAAATFDGNNCYFVGETDGPYQDGTTYVFPKPASGQGNS